MSTTTESKIEWTDYTFNPWRGCTKVSEGCRNCYADTLSKRNPGTLGVWGPNGSRVVAAESYWKNPLKWDREAKADGVRKRVFCASLADVFEDWTGKIVNAAGEVLWQKNGKVVRAGQTTAELVFKETPATMSDVRRRLFALIDATPNLDWLLLTKRPENIGRMMPEWCPADQSDPTGLAKLQSRSNLWLGTSVENQQAADDRIPHLLRVPAAVRFLSCEPLLGAVDLAKWFIQRDLYSCIGCESQWDQGELGRTKTCPDCGQKCEYSETRVDSEIHWVIAGGESGPNARPMQVDWARGLRDQCSAAGVPFFFKQWGEILPASQHESCNTPERRQLSADREAMGLHDTIRVGKKAAGRLLDGREWNGIPEAKPC